MIGNVVKRVLKFLKEEYHTAQQAAMEPLSNPQTPFTPYTPAARRETEVDFFAHARPELTRGQSARSISGIATPAQSTSAPTIFDLLGHKGLISLSSGTDSPLEHVPSLSHLDFHATPSITPSISRANSVIHMRTLSGGGNSPGSPASEYEDFSRHAYRLKRVFTEAISELLDEVDTVHQEIAQQASEHISSGSVETGFPVKR